MSDFGSADEKDDFRDGDEMVEEEDENDEPEQSDQSKEDDVDPDDDNEVILKKKSSHNVPWFCQMNRSMKMHKSFLTLAKSKSLWKIELHLDF